MFVLFLPSADMGAKTGPHGPLDWNAAKTYCEDLGQKLMTIDSQEEEDYLDSDLTAE